MKKILVLFIVPFFIFTYQPPKIDFVSLLQNFSDKSFCYVFDKEVSKGNCIKNGQYFFVYFNYPNAKYFENLKPLYRQVSFSATKKVYQNFVKSLNLKNSVVENFDSSTLVTYGFKANLKEYVVVGSRKINIQVAFSNNRITVGYPMVFGAF